MPFFCPPSPCFRITILKFNHKLYWSVLSPSGIMKVHEICNRKDATKTATWYIRVEINSGNNIGEQLFSYHNFLHSLRISKTHWSVWSSFTTVFCLFYFRRHLIFLFVFLQWLDDCKRTFGTDDGIHGTNTDAQVGASHLSHLWVCGYEILKHTYICCTKTPTFSERLKLYEKLFISVIILSFGNSGSYEVVV